MDRLKPAVVPGSEQELSQVADVVIMMMCNENIVDRSRIGVLL
jgi:hypothetical protein